MSAAVEVRLVPGLDPLPRVELPPVTATGSEIGAVPDAGPEDGDGAGPGAGPVAGPVTGPVAGPVAHPGPRRATRAGAPPATGTTDDGGVPAGGAGAVGDPRTQAPARAPGRDPALAPPADRAAPPEPPPGACQPVVERLGAGSMAAYSHAPPERPATAATVAVPVLPSGAPAGGSPSLDPRQACCMVALAAVEVLAGTRPLAQLARWVTPEVYDALARRAALTAPRTRVLDPLAAPADLVRGGDAPQVRRPSVRRVRACAVGPHSLEASVVVAHADRVRAVAVRLTRSTGRWRASALVVG